VNHTGEPSRTVSRRRVLALALLSAGALAASPAWSLAQPERPLGAPVTLVDPSLAARPARLISIDERQIEIIDELSRQRKLPRASVLAIIAGEVSASGDIVSTEPEPPRVWSSTPLPTPGVLRLADGQRFAGDLAPGAPGAAESLAWDYPAMGRFEVKLDGVHSLRRRGADDAALLAAAPAGADVLQLGNGDRAQGFLVSLGSTIRLEPDGGEVIELPADRVVAARLANPPAPARGMRVWLADGTAARAQRFTLDADGRVLLALDVGPTGSFEWSQVRAVVFDAARLTALASLTPVSQEPVGARRWAPPVRTIEGQAAAGALPVTPLDAPDIELPGPMSVRFDLPEGTRRFATLARLAPGAAPWGDCELVIRVDDREVLRRRLVAGEAAANLAIDAEGRTLTIRVEPGRFGPVNDRVILKRPLLLRDAGPGSGESPR
jgi:hypothetical protein